MEGRCKGRCKMRCKGFTLIEVIVVLLIISLSIALVTPSLSRFSSTVELKGAAKKVSAILRYYRSEAINRGKVYHILFDSDLNEVRIQPVVLEEEQGEGEKKKRIFPPRHTRFPKAFTSRRLRSNQLNTPPTFQPLSFMPTVDQTEGQSLWIVRIARDTRSRLTS